MTIGCAPPDTSLGVALRLSAFVDCQARALGENGFQALAGGPVAAGLLSGLVTIFVALIGYRLILGQTPDVRDGVGWAARLGMVLALATSWPAFQTLIYRVAVDGPGELAAVLLPASGLASENTDARVQNAYDTLRLGSAAQPQTSSDQRTQTSQDPSLLGGSPAAMQQPQPTASGLGQPPLPQTASVLVISTLGVEAAFRIAIGFLLAIGPLAVMALLFDATLGLFSGWVRALAGAALALLAATIVAVIDLVLIESELAALQTYARGMISETVDPQALTTIVLLFCVVMLVAVFAAMRMASAFKLLVPASVRLPFPDRSAAASALPVAIAPRFDQATSSRLIGAPGPTRVAAVADALAATVRREQSYASAGLNSGAPQTPTRRVSITEAAGRQEPGTVTTPLGIAGRRSTVRRTRSAAARDRVA